MAALKAQHTEQYKEFEKRIQQIMQESAKLKNEYITTVYQLE